MKLPVKLSTSAVARNAAVLVAVVAGGAALYWLADILTPLAMAIFLLIMIGGIQREIAERTPVPRRWAGVAALIVVVVGFFASIAIIVDGAAGFFSEASGVTANIGPRIDQIIGDVSAMFGVEAAPTARELIADVDLRGYLTQLAFQVQGVASGAFFVLVYLGFLLASQRGFGKKIVNMFPDRGAREDAMQVMARVRSGVEGYLWVQTVTGIMICAAAWILMRAVGLQNAEFWTFVIFIVGFIPVLGGGDRRPCPSAVRAGAVPQLLAGPYPAGRVADHPVRRRQSGPAPHAGRQPEHRPGRGSAVAGVLGQAVGRGRDVSLDATRRYGHGDPCRVQGVALDRGVAVRRWRAVRGRRAPTRPVEGSWPRQPAALESTNGSRRRPLNPD